MTLANYAMKLEREVWGVLEGPWGSDSWMGWRRDWAQKVLPLFPSLLPPNKGGGRMPCCICDVTPLLL